MDNTVLPRKYRPSAFEDVIGQDHIVSVLQASILNKKMSQAYIFSGGRGLGKTTIARVFAKKLGVNKEDLYEIDAASNNSVEGVRDLNESVHTLPFNSEYKVYILDEVHMLSKSAFNALLKTLEEPPAHVIFILATTELSKVPDTVISRCQSFVFKKPSENTLKQLVLSVSEKEGYKIDGDIADLVALLGDGSFRDTLGTLQKIFSFSKDKNIELSEVERVTGVPPVELVYKFIQALVDKDKDAAFLVLENIKEINIDAEVFLKLVLIKFRKALLVRYSKDFAKKILDASSEVEKTFLENIVKEREGIVTSKTLLVLLGAFENLKYSFLDTVALEIAVVDILGLE